MIFNVRDYGAVGDGKALDTQAIQAALDAAGASGGTVVVPPGTYRVGTIQLRSRVTLDLRQGSTLLGSENLEDYIPRVWGHHNDITPWHLLLAEDVENVVITGEGTIDGSGPAFWNPDRPHEWAFWKEKTRRVSPMVELVRCRWLRVENILLTNSPGWTLHLHDCDHVRVTGVRIRNTWFGPNADGIDLTGCHDTIISDCDIDTADDAIALKTSEYSRSCERIVITNCLLATSCVGVRIGYESREDFKDITISNCVIPRCSRVFDLRSLEGADIRNVSISNIVASTNSGWPVNRPIEIGLHPRGNVFKDALTPEHPDYGKDKPLTRQGSIQDITMRDLDIETDGRITLVADDGHEIRDVSILGLRLRYPMIDDPTAFGRPVTQTSFLPGDHAEARGTKAAMIVKNVRDLRVREWHVRWPEYPVPDRWRLLHSDQRQINPVYPGNEDAVRSGQQRPAFALLWARHLHGGVIELPAAGASEPGMDATDLEDCTAEVR